MSAPKLPIFSGAADEKACIAIMGKLSFTNQCLKILHEQTNKNIHALASLILEQPDNMALRELYIKTHATLKRSKCVATYSAPTENNKKQIIMARHSHELDITNNGDWLVSITEKKRVRIHLTEEARATVLATIKMIPKSKDWVVY